MKMVISSRAIYTFFPVFIVACINLTHWHKIKNSKVSANGFEMQKRCKWSLCQFIVLFVAFLLMNISHAGQPLWTLVPNPIYPPIVSITPDGSAIIKYTVTNQSRRTHTLAMQPIDGISQLTTPGDCPNPFTLAYHQSCTLNLFVDGAQLGGNIYGGPVVCSQGSALQCYQPNAIGILRISRVTTAYYLITPLADPGGSISPNTPQEAISGSNVVFTATPGSGYQVDQWLVDGRIAQKGGSTFTLSSINANHTVEATFTVLGTIYAGTLNGFVYFSTDNGLTWTNYNAPSVGHAVNSVFALAGTLYAGSADGKVYYSTNNGSSWTATTTVSSGSPVNSVFVAVIAGTPTIYAGTQDGNVHYSTNGTVWTATTNPGTGSVNSIFITPSNTIYVGSQDGNVYYSLNNGTTWNTIAGPQAPTPIYNIFATGSQLYVNTRQTSSNSTLPPGTVDFEYAYFSNSLTAPNPVWTLFSQITYTLFVNADASVIHAGTQDGYVFSLSTGDELGFITYSPITSLFFLG